MLLARRHWLARACSRGVDRARRKVLYHLSSVREARFLILTEKVVEKRVVDRNVVITLGVACILLAISLIGAGAICLSQNSQITTLQNKTSLLKTAASSLETAVSDAEGKIVELRSMIDLQNSTVLVYSETVDQQAGSYRFWSLRVDFAGYVSVNVPMSTSTTTYVEVLWSARGVMYDDTIIVGANGTAVFPVLPTNVEVRIGNTDSANGPAVLATVTVTFYY
jgi:cell division protein FtsL